MSSFYFERNLFLLNPPETKWFCEGSNQQIRRVEVGDFMIVGFIHHPDDSLCIIKVYNIHSKKIIFKMQTNLIDDIQYCVVRAKKLLSGKLQIQKTFTKKRVRQ